MKQFCRLFFASAPLIVSAAALDRPEDWLRPTAYIDSAHPAIVTLAGKVTAHSPDARTRAVALHDWVRDEISFGWTGAFYDQKASDVLSSRVGYCNTKSTLFVALLRAAGIPARQHFVDIDARILDGLISPGSAWVDHSYTEVWIEGRWRRTDSYIVDAALAQPARARLRGERRTLGYGVHVDGVVAWNGLDDSFAQFVVNAPGLTATDYGIFADVGAFYAAGPRHNRLNWALRAAFPFFARSANAKAATLRVPAPAKSAAH